MQLTRHLPRAVYALMLLSPIWLQKLVVFLISPKGTVGVSAVIQDPDHRVLVVHHTYRRPSWGLPSGLVARSEQPEATVAREIREELGVEAVVESLICASIDWRYRHLTLHYRVRLLGTPRPVGPELDNLRFVDPVELSRLIGGRAPAWLSGQD